MIFLLGAQMLETFTFYALEKTANLAWWMSSSIYYWYRPKGKKEYDPEALQHHIVDLQLELAELKKMIDNKHLNNEELIK